MTFHEIRSIPSERNLELLLKARTAFPTDLSIGELFEQDLIIESRFTAVGSRTQVSAWDVSKLLHRGNVLILGEPGAGKSVGVLEVARNSGQRILTADLSSGIDWVDRAADQQLRSEEKPTVILVDGVDEYMSRGAAPESIALALESLGNSSTLLVACRNDEYLRLGSFQPVLTPRTPLHQMGYCRSYT